jgi:predicted DNA-binding transcriptional regulator YafY
MLWTNFSKLSGSTNTINMPRTKNPEARQRIIDQLLSKGTRIPKREDFIRMINNRLPADTQPIGPDSFSKDIAKMNEELADRDVKINWTPSKGYHYTRPGFSCYKNEVNEDDKDLMLMATSVLGMFQGTALQEKFFRVVHKVLANSVTAGPVPGSPRSNFVQMVTGSPEKGNRFIPVLLQAIHEKRCLLMTYGANGKPVRKKHICPYVLRQYNGRWYMVAYDFNCERDEKTNVFALQSIQDLDVSNKKFHDDPTFSPEDYFRYSIGVWHLNNVEPVKVVLEFSRHIDLVQANPLHHSQKATLNRDGSLLTVEIEVYHSPELEMLIQGYGSAVKVVSPKELADSIRDNADKILKMYGSRGKG